MDFHIPVKTTMNEHALPVHTPSDVDGAHVAPEFPLGVTEDVSRLITNWLANPPAWLHSTGRRFIDFKTRSPNLSDNQLRVVHTDESAMLTLPARFKISLRNHFVIQCVVEELHEEDKVIELPGHLCVYHGGFCRLVELNTKISDAVLNAMFLCIAATTVHGSDFGAKKSDGKTIAGDTWYGDKILDGTAGLGPICTLENRKAPLEQADIFSILVPFLHDTHITCVYVNFRHKLVLFMDSIHDKLREEMFLAKTRVWVSRIFPNDQELKGWVFKGVRCPPQTNSTDGGVHCIMNALCVTLNTNPQAYSTCNMGQLRYFLAAILLNGGFHGRFRVRHGEGPPYPYNIGGSTFWLSQKNTVMGQC